MLYLLFHFHRKYPKFAVTLLCTEQDILSLSLVQMALWTIAVGAAVLAVSLMQGAVPDIPETLVFLMGLSTVTAFTGHWQSTRQRELTPASAEATAAANKAKDKDKDKELPWKGLLFGRIEGQLQPMFAKAQLLFWTVLSLLLFLGKSFYDGALWKVPQVWCCSWASVRRASSPARNWPLESKNQRSR